jgi:CBS domain-containing protein
MAFTLEDLLPSDQQLRTVQPHEPVGRAMNIRYEHRYGQLPVTGPNSEFHGQVITFESILRAIQSFRTEAETLLVRDAAQRVSSYPADADLLATLDDIHRDNFALIVDESRLIGIVTTADVAVFFR